MTKMHREQSVKLLSKDEVRKKYPGFKDDNINFYLKVLTQYMRVSLGVVTKDQLNKQRQYQELERASLISKKIDEQLKIAKEKVKKGKVKKEDPIANTL